jgi:hypothetical protein
MQVDDEDITNVFGLDAVAEESVPSFHHIAWKHALTAGLDDACVNISATNRDWLPLSFEECKLCSIGRGVAKQLKSCEPKNHAQKTAVRSILLVSMHGL